MSNLISAAVQRRIVGSATRKSVLLYMADRAADDGSGIWTSKANIARDLELSTRAVQLAIHALIGAGLVREAGQRDCKHGFVVEYSINVEAVDNLSSTRESRSPVVAKTLSTPESGSPHPLNQIHPNNPYKDTTTARASGGPVGNSPQGRCLAAAGRGLCPAGRQSITATSEVIHGWLTEGFDLELDVLPVIASRTVAMRAAPIRTWAYFSDAVREAHRARVAKAESAQNAENSMVSGGKACADRVAAAPAARSSGRAATASGPVTAHGAAPMAPVVAGDDPALRFFADWLNGDKYLPQNAVSNGMAAALLKAGLVSRERMRVRGVPFVDGGW